MEIVSAQGQSSDLDTFVDFLYDGLQGYVYLAAKNRKTDDWLQEHFLWPAEKSKLISTIEGANSKLDIYIAPVIFSKPSGKREHVLASNVVWADFDGNAPDSWEGFPGEPSLVLQSSSAGHQHVYWKLTEPLSGAESIEHITRRIAYNVAADNSGWDANQVLRPPNTRNHKREADTSLIHYSKITFSPDSFGFLPEVKETTQTEWELGELPSVETVLLRYALTPDVIRLLQSEIPEGKRSDAIMQMAYACAEIGMSNNEIFVLLLSFDDRIGKFKGRKDREKQLARIITTARNKYPDSPSPSQETEEQSLLAFDYKSFMATEIIIDWVIEPMLMDYGSMLMAGPSGIGKTQLSLQFIKHIALGKDYLHYKIDRPRKILFLSLEMGHPSLQHFMKIQDAGLTDSERELLARNLIIVPLGEPLALNTPVGQSQAIMLLDKFKPEGLFVDSVGSSIIGNIGNAETVQPLLAFNDHVSKHYGCFTWYIHHTRKKQVGGGSGDSQDDVYGDQYLVNRASSVYLTLPAKEGSIKIKNVKNRMAREEEQFTVARTDDLNFIKLNENLEKGILDHYKDKEGPNIAANGIGF